MKHVRNEQVRTVRLPVAGPVANATRPVRLYGREQGRDFVSANGMRWRLS